MFELVLSRTILAYSHLTFSMHESQTQKVSLFLGLGPFTWAYAQVQVHYCHAPLHEECMKHHGDQGDPGVTPWTCGAVCERAQVILVWMRVSEARGLYGWGGVAGRTHPMPKGTAYGRWPNLGAWLPRLVWVVVMLLRQRDDQLKIGLPWMKVHILPLATN